MVDLPQTKPRPTNPSFMAPRSIIALILREMSTSYGRSPGGYLWAILEPVAGILLLTAIFSIGFRSPPLGKSFALFYATGMLSLLMFNDLVGKLGTSMTFSRALLEYPRVSFADALAARLILNTLTQLMVHAVVYAGIFTFLTTSVTVDYTKVMAGYAMLIVLAAGIGTLNAFLIVSYPLWKNIWSILTRPLFIISAVFFTLESVPQPYRDYLWWNPIVHIVGMMRDGIYPFYKPDYVSPIFVCLVGIITGIWGLLLLRRYYRDMLLR